MTKWFLQLVLALLPLLISMNAGSGINHIQNKPVTVVNQTVNVQIHIHGDTTFNKK